MCLQQTALQLMLVSGFDLELLGPGLGFGTKPSHV